MGLDDFAPAQVYDNLTVPATRVDGQGAKAVRYYSLSTRSAVDCWYGINAGIMVPDMRSGPPCRMVGRDLGQLGKMNQVRRASEMVFYFDGLYIDYGVINANRINARHGRQTQTNLAFFDGHAVTYRTAGLPGGLGKAAVSDFSIANLKTKYPSPPNPMWLIEQQN